MRRLLLLILLRAVPAAAQNQPATLTLNTAPQDQAVYLSWNRAVSRSFDVAWRPVGGLAWQHADVSGSFFTVKKLQNGVRYQFRLSATEADGVSRYSPIMEGVPRVRDDCAYGAAVFCTPEALLAALPGYQMQPSDLRCFDRPIGSAPDMIPNCRFQLPGFALGLDRYMGERFTPPSRLADPAVVRAVLLRAVWGTDDPRVMRRIARESVTPISIPYRGRVASAVTAQSYLVQLAPTLYGRITQFTPANRIGGRYAIFHEGHGEAAVAGGAQIIDWLLDRGWEVWGVDMPLEGLNEADRRQPLLGHDDIPFVEPDPSAAMRLFFQGIAAAISLILEEAPPGSTLMSLGRSGGAWTSYIYAAMDPRIDISVNISGGSPASTQMDSTLFHRPSPHYENLLPYLTDQVSSTDLLLAGGTRASFHFYNSNDPCCYRFTSDHPWIQYVNALGARSSLKLYRAFVGNGSIHGLTPQAFEALERYLAQAGVPSPARGPQRPNAPFSPSPEPGIGQPQRLP